MAAAVRNNPALRADSLAWRAELERVKQAGAWEDPELEIGIFPKPMDVLDGRQVADFRLMQMLPWPGTRRAARDEARGMAAMEWERFRAARDELVLELKTAWWELVSLNRQLANVHSDRQLLASLKSLAAGRLASGRGGVAEALRIEMTLAELEATEVEITSAAATARARFNALLGREADSPLVVPDSIAPVAVPTNSFLPDRNPMAGMALAQGEAADARVKMERRMGLPMIGVGVRYSVIGRRMAMEIPTTAMNGRDMVMPMVSISLPVWRGARNARVAESRLLSEAAAARRRDVMQTLESSLVAAREALVVAARRMELTGRQADLTRAAYVLAESEFSSGEGSLADVLEVRRQLLEIALNHATAIAEHNTAVAKIEKIVSQ